jgi:hypothetical protein
MTTLSLTALVKFGVHPIDPRGKRSHTSQIHSAALERLPCSPGRLELQALVQYFGRELPGERSSESRRLVCQVYNYQR